MQSGRIRLSAMPPVSDLLTSREALSYLSPFRKRWSVSFHPKSGSGGSPLMGSILRLGSQMTGVHYGRWASRQHFLAELETGSTLIECAWLALCYIDNLCL